MAEFAQRSIEEMLVEAEKMKKIGLFTHEEIRAIMKKRKRFEYKMQRRTKEKDVYLQYIQYEIGVYQLIKLRREKKRIELGRDEIDKAVALRIYKLFRIACFRFKSDTKLWLTHIEFAKNNMDRERVSKIFTTMLQVHNKKPNLWIMAAKFEIETNESIETARLLFQRALRFLPDNRKIWIEYFKMELLCVEIILKRKEMLGITNSETIEKLAEGEENKKTKQEDAILSCKIVEVVFRNAIKQVKENIPYLIHKFILIAMKFKFASNLVNIMFNTLTEDENLSKCEESWDVLARRHLLEEEDILKKCAETGQVADFTIAEFEEKANEAFLKAVNELNTKRMHELYIEFLIERLKLNSKFLNDERFLKLNEAFQNAQAEFGLSFEHTLEWIETSIKFDKVQEALELIEKTLANYSTNEKLWAYYLKINISLTGKHNEKELIDLFHKSIQSVKSKNALNLWELIVDWALLNNYSQIENLFKEGSQVMNREIASFTRCKYLDWSMQNADGLAKMRQIYKNLRQVPPYDLDFYLKYVEIEKCAPKINEKLIEAAFEDALIHFDKENIDLWLSYIEFEYTKSITNTESVAELYKRALKRLDNELVESFTQKFVLLKINLNHDSKIEDVEMD